MSSIIIHEPDDLMSRLLLEWLTGAGYTVYDAMDVEPHAPVSLVIASVSTTELEREILIPRLRRSYPEAAVIVLSSQARSGLSSDGALARVLGVQRVMAKPLRRGELLMTVADLIGPPLRN
jgi:DNA-binding response OmpR family regulator